MGHSIYRTLSFEISGPRSVRVLFDDGTEQNIDLTEILEGELFGPLKDPNFFARVELDPEAHTLVWPNGADLDPETLHDWPRYRAAMIEMAKHWASAKAGR